MDEQQTLRWLNAALPVPLKVARGGAFQIGAGQVAGHAVACTTDFAAVDTGLELAERPGFDVRVELMDLASTSGLNEVDPRRASLEAAVRVVGTAAAELADAASTAPGEPATPVAPGRLLEGLAARAGLNPALSVGHGLLAAPIAWRGQVPQCLENPGEVAGAGADPARGRQTMVLQILMLTGAEYALARDGGVGNLFGAWQRAGVDPGDWARPDAATAAG